MQPLNAIVLKWAYYLEESHRYKRFKGFFKELLEAEHARIKFYFDMLMIFLVITTVLLLLYEVKNPPTPFTLRFETVAFTIFVIEYFARIWVHSDIHRIIIQSHEEAGMLEQKFSLRSVLVRIIKDKFVYITSPTAIIDLLAIMPDYRFLRFLRLFRLFRLFKLFRYVKSMNVLSHVLVAKQFELKILALVASFVIFTSASAFYVMEGDIQDNLSFFNALYWSVVTISTVGYGDVSAVTEEGKVISIFLIIVGISILAFLTSIVLSYFNERLDELRENRAFADIERMGSYIVICGYGRVGEVVAKMLHQNNEPFVVIENNDQRTELARGRGIKTIKGDASHSDILSNVLISGRVKQLFCLTHDDALNTFIILTARTLDPHMRIISRVDNEKNRKKLLIAGADATFNPFETAGMMALEYVQQPIGYHAFEGIILGTGHTEISNIEIPVDSHLIGQSLQVLKLQARKTLLFGIVRRDNGGQKVKEGWRFGEKYFFFNPPDGFIIEAYDRLLLMGHRHRIEHLLNEIDKSTL